MKPAIITYTDLDRYTSEWRNSRIVLTGGCFDVLHYGHVTFLQKAKESGDLLVIALESDSFIKKIKGRDPFHSQHERAYILTALRMVDYVILLPHFENEIGYNELVQKVKPAVVAITEGDTAADKKRIHVEQVGGILKIVTPLLSTFSTTNILNYETIFSSPDSTTSD
ncbi:hypothetical protein BH09PAT2_BH09PAT2_06740 [soil metagenome]